MLKYLIILFLLAGCVAPQKVEKKRYESQLSYLSKKLRVQKKHNENLKDENMVLRQLAGIPEPALNRANREGRADLKVYSEKFMYEQVVKAFNAKDLVQLDRAATVLAQQYPRSKKIDNSIYLKGLLNYKLGKYAESLTLYDEILDKHSTGNKAPAAMLGKALAYKSLNLTDQSRYFFDTVMQKYPNSPESIRAKREIRDLESL